MLSSAITPARSLLHETVSNFESLREPPVKPLTKKLLDWYRTNARTLPWRNHPDAYAVWISEIMLQQTRVETVIPYFERWMNRFPTIPDLAKAAEQEVLTSWEGLGYYGRARNLHKAAGLVMEKHGGAIPIDPATLQDLPGIGRYTASAILSMAFGQDTATLDGNSKRVLSRLFNMEEPVDLPDGEKRLWGLAERYLPRGRAGEYNQAFMDLGAMICLPKNPRCMMCPVMEFCQAHTQGTQDLRPVKKPRKQIPHYIVTAAVIRQA